MPTSSNVASNATTVWTVGKQKDSINSTLANSDAYSNTVTTNSPTTTKGDESEGAVKPLENANVFSSRSKFLRAFGKFKNKHLPSKKANDAAIGEISATNNNRISSITTNSTSNAPSFVLPPIQFENEVSLTSAELSSDLNTTRFDSASLSTNSLIEPITPKKENFEQLHDIDMEDSEATQHPYSHQVQSASSSLRIKLKNRVNHTLASIKSSSNIREKANSQSAPLSSSIPHSSELPSVQRSQSPTDPNTADPHQSNNMMKIAKPFWTFPRVRPEPSTPSKVLPWGNNDRPSSMSTTPRRVKSIQITDLDTAMISPELAPSAIEDVDSDDSIDIILPSDYDDYTQFAELPLKKRKKLEAARAAAAAAAAAATSDSAVAQNTSNKRSSGVKRFLLPQKVEKNKGKANEPSHTSDGPAKGTVSPRASKKRPKDQDSIEQRLTQEPNKMAKSNSEEPSEWRKAIMKSLHIGKGNQSTRKTKGLITPGESPLESPVEGSYPHSDKMFAPKLPNSPQRDSGVYPSDHGSRPKRSDSINSTRSMTLSSQPVLPASRRETLEMAMRRRRRSSAARSNLFDPEQHLGIPRNMNYYDDDAASAHVTHTFTSFTLELSDIHANAVVNNSAIPGLFNFKRQPRLTMSSMNQVDTEAEFKGFDSDGDAMSGYTGDADISMEEIFVRPKTPVLSRSSEGRKSRESGSIDRRMSIGDDSDSVTELPSLTIRSRELNRSSSSGRFSNHSIHSIKSNENTGRESPRSIRRTGSSTSPSLTKKTSRNILNGSPAFEASQASSDRNTPTQMTKDDDAVSWKARNNHQSRPTVPALNTKSLLAARANGQSSSTTSAQSRTSHSTVPTILTQSHSYHSSVGSEGSHHHRQFSSTFQHHQGQHQQQGSADTLLPNHLKNFSTASTLSASSGYSAQTLNGNGPLLFQAKEFDPSHDLDPATPVDLKGMDFETLLKTAEREQQKGQEERTLKKKKSFQFQNSRPLKINHHGATGDRNNAENISSGFYKGNLNSSTKSALSALVASAPNLDDLRTRGSESNYTFGNYQHSPPNSSNHIRNHSNGSKFGGLQVQTNRVEQRPLGPNHPRVPISKSAITFDLAESEAFANEGRNNPRSRRVMKKKTSVIKLSGNVQGRREDDGMIRVSIAPTVDHRQWRS
ncbi:hypothetical protein BGZ76_008092 [Entomortierella beljakovae]|nr:hypothetical protein BGZ76_008092 [Entomortierella beljakovae]